MLHVRVFVTGECKEVKAAAVLPVMDDRGMTKDRAFNCPGSLQTHKAGREDPG